MNLKFKPEEMIFPTYKPQLNVSELEKSLSFIKEKNESDISPEESKQLALFNNQKKMILIFASNKFEGSKLSQFETYRILQEWMNKSLEEIQEALDQEPIQENKRSSPSSRREVLQHYVAFENLHKHLNEELEEELIKSTHKLLMQGFLDYDGQNIDEGKYRTENVSANGFLFLDPKYVEESMTKLVAKFNENVKDPNIDSCLLAGCLMAEFLTIHPFNDGNGRMSRLLFNYALAKRGIRTIIPIVDVSANRELYMKALKRYQQGAREKHTERLSILWLLSANLVQDFWLEFDSFKISSI